MDAKRRKCAGFLKKREDWLIPGFCCLILFLAAGLAWDYYYDLNDDVLIRDILSGVYTGEPEALTAQLLWPLGALLAGLYRLLPGLPVFGAFLWLCQAGSVFLILRRSLLWLEARADGETPALSGQDGAGCPPCPVWKKLLLCFLETLTAAVCLLYHLVFVQYTVTAGLLAAAAVFYFLTVPRNLAASGKEESAVSFWLRCLPAALLFWLAFCLRSEMGLLLLPLAGVAGIWKWSDCRPVFTKKKIAAFAGFFGWIVAGLLVCLGADRLACSDRAGWRLSGCSMPERRSMIFTAPGFVPGRITGISTKRWGFRGSSASCFPTITTGGRRYRRLRDGTGGGIWKKNAGSLCAQPFGRTVALYPAAEKQPRHCAGRPASLAASGSGACGVASRGGRRGMDRMGSGGERAASGIGGLLTRPPAAGKAVPAAGPASSGSFCFWARCEAACGCISSCGSGCRSGSAIPCISAS